MKIGTCVNFSEIDGMEKKFAQLREHNFDSCQLVSWNPAAWTDENANTLKTLLEQYQITVSAFWCGWTGHGTFTTDHSPLDLSLWNTDRCGSKTFATVQILPTSSASLMS